MGLTFPAKGLQHRLRQLYLESCEVCLRGVHARFMQAGEEPNDCAAYPVITAHVLCTIGGDTSKASGSSVDHLSEHH